MWRWQKVKANRLEMEGKNAQLQSGPSRSWARTLLHIHPGILPHMACVHMNFSIPASLVCWWIERVHCILCDATLQVEMQTATAITICQDMLGDVGGARTLLEGRGGSCLVPCAVCISAAALFAIIACANRSPKSYSSTGRRGRGDNGGYRTEPFATKKATTQSSHRGQKIREGRGSNGD